MIKWINWKELNDRAKTNKGGKLVAVDNESLPALKCVEWSFSQNPEFKKLTVHAAAAFDNDTLKQWLESFSYLGHANSLSFEHKLNTRAYIHRPVCLNTGPGVLCFYFVHNPEYPAGSEPKLPPAQYD